MIYFELLKFIHLNYNLLSENSSQKVVDINSLFPGTMTLTKLTRGPPQWIDNYFVHNKEPHSPMNSVELLHVGLEVENFQQLPFHFLSEYSSGDLEQKFLNRRKSNRLTFLNFASISDDTISSIFILLQSELELKCNKLEHCNPEQSTWGTNYKCNPVGVIECKKTW